MAISCNGINQYLEGGADVLQFPITIGCRVWVDNENVDKGSPFSLTAINSTNIRMQLRLAVDNLAAFTVKGLTGQIGTFGVYNLNAWNTVVCVAASAVSRTFYVNGVVTSTISDTGGLSNITTMMVGARRDATGLSPENFFKGSIADVFVTNSAWSSVQEVEYRAGAEPELVTNNNVVSHKNFICDYTAPDIGQVLTPVFAPPFVTHDPVSTGQNHREITVTGTHTDVVATTFSYNPLTDFVGEDVIKVEAEDATNMFDYATSVVSVEELPILSSVTGFGQFPVARKRRT